MEATVLVPRAGQAQPPHGHTRRAAAGSRRDPQTVLDKLPLGTRQWRRVLWAILTQHNHAHANKHKGVGYATMTARRGFLLRFFVDVRANTQYSNLDPRQLATRHIEASIQLWIRRGLSTATIHNYLSFLRTFAGWIGKPGMVRSVEYYVGSASPHAHRHQNATHDHSWCAQDVDVDAIVPKVRELDPWVAAQLELCHQFALRPNEARFLRPHHAVVSRSEANPRDAEAAPEVSHFLQVHHGTKGGRPRDVPIATERQRELLTRVTAMVEPGLFVGDPARSATQNRRRFYYVLERCGITKASLGVVAHGLRHQHANDEFEALTGEPSPVRGGGAVPRELRDHGRKRVARVLGHNRPRVTSCYLGSQRHTAAQPPTDQEPQIERAAEQIPEASDAQ